MASASNSVERQPIVRRLLSLKSMASSAKRYVCGQGEGVSEMEDTGTVAGRDNWTD